MKAKCSVGGRCRKNDARSVFNWCGKLDLVATLEGDPFLLAAVYRALFGDESDAKALKRSLLAEARRCAADHQARVQQTLRKGAEDG